jgi:hypothetical protein
MRKKRPRAWIRTKSIKMVSNTGIVIPSIIIVKFFSSFFSQIFFMTLVLQNYRQLLKDSGNSPRAHFNVEPGLQDLEIRGPELLDLSKLLAGLLFFAGFEQAVNQENTGLYAG